MKNSINTRPEVYTLIDRSEATNPTLPVQQREHLQRHKSKWPDFSEPKTKILFAATLIVIPMLLFPTILLYVVFKHRVDETVCPIQQLCPPGKSRNGEEAYLVNFPAPKLIFISSWASSVSFSLVGTMMLLASYPIANGILRRSSADHDALPTPYQLCLMIGCLNGEWKSIWDVLMYKLTWGKRMAKVVTSLRAALVMLCCTMLLGLIVQFTDTWLHLVTEAISLTQIYPTLAMAEGPSQGLAPWCLDNLNDTLISDQTDPISCAMDDNYWFYNLSSVYGVLSNRSDSQRVYTVVDNNISYALLGPSSFDPAVDYIASTYSVATECVAIASQCNLTNLADYLSLRRKRQDGVTVNMTVDCKEDPTGVNLAYDFGDDWTMAVDVFDGSSVRWGLAAAVDAITATNGESISSYLINGGIWNDLTSSGWTVITACNTTVWDTTYTYFNGTMNITDLQRSNDTIARILNDVYTYANRSSLTTTLQNSWKLANSEESQIAQDYLDRFAPSVSQISAGFLAGQLSQRPEIQSQTRTEIIVTKIPTAPLWTLVASNLLYAAIALLLAILAMGYSTRDVGEAQQKLNTSGLVAALFDKPHAEFLAESNQESFDEANDALGGPELRVGLSKRAAGGLNYNTWQSLKQR